MRNYVCGLDFGTSNSTIGVNLNNQVKLTSFNNESKLRSAIFYQTETKQLIFGDPGVEQYLQGEPGRLMMSLKSLLGSSLLHEQTLIGNRLVPFTEVIGQYFAFLKNKTEETIQYELTQVVLGRPVVFHQDPEKDQAAQNTLEEIAKSQGFKEICFQYEPLAAGFAYEATLNQEQLVLIVDMGGGTSDFSIIKLGGSNRLALDRSADILANHGVRIAGTDFDRRLSLASIMPLLGLHSLMRGSSGDIEVPDAIYHELTTWHLLRKLYSRQTIEDVKKILQIAHQKKLIQRLLEVLIRQEGHRILYIVESAKKLLSEHVQAILNLDFIEDSLVKEISRQQFNESITEYRRQLLAAISETVLLSGVMPNNIDAIFYTGGTTMIPVLRNEIEGFFPQAKIIHGDVFGSVGVGLTIEAMRKFLLK